MAEVHDGRLLELVGGLGGERVRDLFRDLLERSLQELVDAELTEVNLPGFLGGSDLWEDGAMTRRQGKYPDAVRERAVRLVVDQRGEYESEWAAICSVASKSGMSAETLRLWVRQAERDEGRRPGLSTEERERLRRLERDNRELRRANEILKAAAAFFGAELDRQPKR